MIQRSVLIAFVFTFSLCASTRCVAQGTPDSLPTLTLSGTELRLPLSQVLPEGYLFWARAKPSDLNIDYLKSDPPHASFSALAAEAVTVGGLCHVARLHPKLQIVQSCPAPKDTQTRLKAWLDFLSGKRKQLPPGAQVYVVRNGTDIFPVVGAELRVKLGTLNQILNRKIPILTKLSPPCQFPPSANGKKITELCARSLPIPIPDFSASIKEIDPWKVELVLTRLMPGPSSALLALQAGKGQQVRVRVNVEAPSCEFGGRRYTFGDTPTAYLKSVVEPGETCTGIPLVCAPEDRPVPLRGRWVNKEDNIEFSPSGLFSSCQVRSCTAGQTLYKGSVFLDFDKDGYYSKREINRCLAKNNISDSLGTVSWQEQGGQVIMWSQHPVFPATGSGPTGKTEPASGDTDPNSPQSQSSSSSSSSSSSTGWGYKKCCVCLFDEGVDLNQNQKQCEMETDCQKWHEEQGYCSISTTQDMAVWRASGEPLREFIGTVCGGVDRVNLQIIRHGCPEDVDIPFCFGLMVAEVTDARLIDLVDDACLLFDQQAKANAAAGILRQRLKDAGFEGQVHVTSNTNVTKGNISPENSWCSPITYKVCASEVRTALHPCHASGTPCTVHTQTTETWPCIDREEKKRTMRCVPYVSTENDHGGEFGSGRWLFED